MVTVARSELDVLRALSGTGYLRVIGPDQLQIRARLSIGAHAAAYNLGLPFFGLGFTLFGYLPLKSNYIARALAVFGIISSLPVLSSSCAVVVIPIVARTVVPACYVPIFLFEFATGVWLLGKGLRPAATVRARTIG